VGIVIPKLLVRGLALAVSLCLGLATVPLNGAVIVQLRVIEGEGGVYGVGSRATRGITVQVTDEAGKPVDGASVSFRLPEGGPSGVFPGGLRTEVVTTKPDGRATIWGMQWGKAAGPFEIRITAVKDQARAGIVSSQYLSDTQVAKSAGSPGGFQTSHHSRNKWLLITAAAAGAGAGMVFAKSSGTKAGTAPSAVAAPPVIGNPTVTIGPPR
jgi:hypothetical protein